MPLTLPVIDRPAQELDRRLRGPQRHRLLHGYPLAAAMWPRRAGAPDDVRLDPAAGRGLLVGVLPHPFCNPAVTGCGFCTFPHEKYDASRAAQVVTAVCREVEARAHRQPELVGRAVTALYFGGGTANLSPAEPFRSLCRTLARVFDLRGAEVTIEGVPAYFLKRRPLLLDVLREELPARHFRVSMGIQTFDERRLERMGRLAFGTAETFRAVTEEAHARGFTASADLLFNLPHQTLAAMRDDVSRAVQIGLDHVGLYHLVLFRGLGTAWSHEKELLAGLPDNAQAAEHWLALRAQLLEVGFTQTTLTNFERGTFRADPRRFLYEECSFQPHRFEMLGFGPSAISFAAGRDFQDGLKVLNPVGAAEYVGALRTGGPAWDRWFGYGPRDVQIFYLTRRLAALEIDRWEYQDLFAADALADFAAEFRALEEAGLVEVRPRTVRPTPRGMFYADTIASLWAGRRSRAREPGEWGGTGGRSGGPGGDEDWLSGNGHGHM
jgi:oxygen-independent coproporphyrinogen-3 oxidase